MGRRAGAVTVALALMLGTGCSEGTVAGTTTTSTGSSSSSSAGTTTSTTSSWSTSSGPNDEEIEHPDAGTSPTWDDQARDDAVAAAEEVLTAFARPTLSQGSWWHDLGPMLTPAARETYRYVDVAQVPVTRVRGHGRLVEEQSAYLARVEISTDAGPYRVLLTRTEQGAPWLAERIEPVRGEG